MHIKKLTTSYAILSILISSLLSSCKQQCLPEPETDDTPPSAGLRVSYYVNGKEETMGITTEDEVTSTTIEADYSKDVFVIYSGADKQGMESLNLGYSIVIVTGNSTSTTLAEAIPETRATCPVDLLMGSHLFEANHDKGSYMTLTLHTRNWEGLESSGVQIKIKFVSR